MDQTVRLWAFPVAKLKGQSKIAMQYCFGSLHWTTYIISKDQCCSGIRYVDKIQAYKGSFLKPHLKHPLGLVRPINFVKENKKVR